MSAVTGEGVKDLAWYAHEVRDLREGKTPELPPKEISCVRRQPVSKPRERRRNGGEEEGCERKFSKIVVGEKD